MALSDIFKSRKSNKIHQQVWPIIWDRVKTPPADDAAARELHAVFVGTLLYATRYQAAIAAGMEDSIAKTVALHVVSQANFDEQMRDRVLSVFSANAEDGAAEYAATLSSLMAAIVGRAKSRGGAPEGASGEDLLKELDALMPVLAEHVAAGG